VSAQPVIVPPAIADNGGSFTLRRIGEGRFEGHGALTFATAKKAWEEGIAVLRADPTPALEVDCAGITVADSAGLVVLLDWLALARKHNRGLTFRYLPESVLAVAAISDLKDLLQGGL
jgi:phospholipid transport system transporter-binding protein